MSKASSAAARTARAVTCCKQWTDCTKRWDALTSKGLELANAIANQQLACGYATPAALGSLGRMLDAADMLAADLIERTAASYPQLVAVIEDSRQLTRRMAAVSANIRGLQSDPGPARPARTEPPSTPGPGRPPTPTPTLPHGVSFETLAQKSDALLAMYELELAAREVIVGTFLAAAGTADRKRQLLYLSVWLHEPYLDGKGHELARFFSTLYAAMV